MRKVSVVIVTYNSERHIYDCLESLFKYNDIGDALEVIVVDNCSKDYEGMAKQITFRYGYGVKLVQNTNNGGYGQGNNVGIMNAAAPIIMIMNPDVRLCEPVFAKVFSNLNRRRIWRCMVLLNVTRMVPWEGLLHGRADYIHI